MRGFTKRLCTCSLAATLLVILAIFLFSNECSAYVYWSNSGLDIGRADLDGSNPNQSWITGCDGLLGVAVDANHVYWSNYFGGTIGRANLDGSSPNQSWITGCDGPLGIALDPPPPPAPPPAQAVPTLGEWGMIIFASLIILIGFLALRRRKSEV